MGRRTAGETTRHSVPGYYQSSRWDAYLLLLMPFLHYHRLKGSARYSIDADSRKSAWRITFEWENFQMKDVQLVRIEDTH